MRDCTDKDKLMSTGQVGDNLSKFRILNKKKNTKNLKVKRMKLDWKHTAIEFLKMQWKAINEV